MLKSIVCTYPDFRTLPKGVKQMLVISENLFFEEIHTAPAKAANEQTAAGAPTGDALVQVGAAYISYGQNDKAAAAISKGIAKGGLKSPDEANLLLGIAQLRQRNNAAAQQAFDKVAGSSNAGYARLGRLWALRAHSA